MMGGVHGGGGGAWWGVHGEGVHGGGVHGGGVHGVGRGCMVKGEYMVVAGAIVEGSAWSR